VTSNDEDDDISRTSDPPEDDSYMGFAGGPLVGPTTYAQDIAMQTHDLASIFLAILLLKIFSK
jgi:hypothetical protein